MAFEGGFAGVLLLINTVVFLIILICILLYMCLRNDHDAASKILYHCITKCFSIPLKKLLLAMEKDTYLVAIQSLQGEVINVGYTSTI